MAKTDFLTADMTRRQFMKISGKSLAGLTLSASMLSLFGCSQQQVDSGAVATWALPQGLLVVNADLCTGCQRCEMMCTLKNDGRVCQEIARVRVWDNYNFGAGPDTNEGSFGLGEGACEFTVEHCKQCADPQCANYCPVHAISADSKTGARVVDPSICIGCGMCSQACPWNMPRIDPQTNTSTKCISCGRCAEQCPNGAIQFIDWQDIAQAVIDQGVVRTVTLVEA